VMARHRLGIVHATRTFVEPIAVGGGIGSPCSRNDWMCRGIASVMSSSTSSRERPAATQPGRSGTYAPQASPSCSMTTTYSVTILPSRPASLPPDRTKRTLRHLITRLACHRHRSRAVGMAELAVRANLPIEAPAVTLQGTDDISDFHGPRVRERCDDLVERSTSQRDVQGSRRGTVRRGNSLVIGLAPPAGFEPAWYGLEVRCLILSATGATRNYATHMVTEEGASQHNRTFVPTGSPPQAARRRVTSDTGLAPGRFVPSARVVAAGRCMHHARRAVGIHHPLQPSEQ